MRAPALPPGTAARAALVLAVLVLLGGTVAGLARGERTQRGNLIVSLDGGLSPLKLPRDRAAPVAVHLNGGLRTADGSTLPQITHVELGLPGQGVVRTVGLPLCSLRKLRDATRDKAMASCGGALVGRGTMKAQIVLPNQAPFTMRARLLAFNGRLAGRRALLVLGTSSEPPTSAVLPFTFRRGEGRFDTALRARLTDSLGPWPRLANFELTLSRRYRFRDRAHSYISASCPIPERFTAGFFSFAKASFTLANGRSLSTAVARSCRAR